VHKHTGNLYYPPSSPLFSSFALNSLLRIICIPKKNFLQYCSITHSFIFACLIILLGVPQALISVNAIDYLCDLFSSSNDTTIGIASVALGYLSYVPEGQRKLLHRYLVKRKFNYKNFFI
jgi:hypothetical protein